MKCIATTAGGCGNSWMTRSCCILTAKPSRRSWGMGWGWRGGAARHAGSSVVTAGHVRAALDAKIDRHNLLETKIREMIEQNLVFIDTDGGRAGQINGLSVMESGGYPFSKTEGS